MLLNYKIIHNARATSVMATPNVDIQRKLVPGTIPPTVGLFECNSQKYELTKNI